MAVVMRVVFLLVIPEIIVYITILFNVRTI
jgi:hypothetical protein